MRNFLIVGGGVVGAGAGYFLSKFGTVTLLEMERAPGYHSTGRSAALFSEYFGNPAVRGLTAASRAFLAEPPDGFTGEALLGARGVLAVCPEGGEELFERTLADGRAAPTPAVEIDVGEVGRHCPIVRSEWCSRAMVKPAAMDIDVDALHQGFLRGIRAAGGRVVTSAKVRALARERGGWRAVTDVGEYGAAVVINAAGAWADDVARLAGVRTVGLRALRRTAFLVDLPEGVDAARWPMVTDVADTFYFKPESGRLLVSPSDATPVPPGDVRAEDVDVAVGIERVREVTTLRIRSVRHAWAGLRSVVADETPVIGEALDAPGFVWMAGLGGFGVQTAPEVGRIGAAAAMGAPPDPAFAPERLWTEPKERLWTEPKERARSGSSEGLRRAKDVVPEGRE